MEQLTCPICGEPMENRMKLGSHMWSKHKVKLKEYEAGLSASQVNESAQPKVADGLIKPQQITEAKEFINEPAVKFDKEFVQENTVSDGEFVKQTAEYRNPYKDLYKDDNGFVLNERLSR